jgi:serine protein kinase
MTGLTDSRHEAVPGRIGGSLIEEMANFATHHKASRWRGTFAEFLRDVFPAAAPQLVRTSHQYLYDMLGWYRAERPDTAAGTAAGNPKDLFTSELYGIDEALDRVVEYFKAASAGSDVGRRLLLLLGPPSGGKSSAVILMKRGLEEYSHTDAGALYALQGSPLHESPLNLVPASLRGKFRETYGVEISGELSPYSRARLDEEFRGDFMQFPVERIFLAEAARVGVGTYAPHDPTTADIADLVGSVDLSKVAEIGDEGDPRAWSWSGAVYAASRGMLEMIEILKVKREFLYLLLTLTQEKNVKVSRFPLIHLDETIVAHTNLAEFNRFLQEKENEALLDRMVIVKVPYTLSYLDEARIYQKLVSNAPAFRAVHMDPHVLPLAAVFSILTRLTKPEKEGLDLSRKLRVYAGEDVEGVSASEVERLRAESPDEGLSGVSPRFVINAISNAITRSDRHSLTSMEMLLALKDAIQSDARMDAAQKKTCGGLPGDGAQGLLQPLGQGRRAPRAVCLLRGRGAAAAGEVPGRGRGLARPARGEGSDHRRGAGRPTSASCARWRRRSRSPSPASSPSARKWCARPWWRSRPATSSRSTATRACTRPSSSTCSRSAATCCGW